MNTFYVGQTDYIEKLNVLYNAVLITGSILPPQTSNSGKFLKTDGSVAYWDTVTQNTVSIANLADTNLSNLAGTSISSSLVPRDNETIDLGSATKRFRKLYLAGSTIDLGGVLISAANGIVNLPEGSTIGTTTIGAAQIQSSWIQTNSNSLDYIANKPSLATVATSGSYNDLINKPTIPSLTGYATITYVDSALASLIDVAPIALDTLKEIATALGNDPNYATTITTALSLKANIASPTFTGTVGGITASMVGLGNVTNESKPTMFTSPTFTGTVTLGTINNIKINSGSLGQLLSTDGSGNLSWINTPDTKTYYWSGVLTLNTGSLRYYIPQSATLTKININLNSAGTTPSSIAIRKNNTIISTITVPSNTTSLQTAVSIGITANDYLTVDITQASTASDLYVTFIYG
ncbi:hypothetical protein UFOVP961_133 [uncultured Caudovirales phage]|uniref:Tail fiber protein n=1 Tax=uncultured Caudovirales phage TaxID=2100421 RepID=A0A6J7XI14_9CAUD|nr:hypothetical protein UFOVP961_133 [uncultured Caudovirales phage]CAB4185380.1 hypothetical protein UFOVP1123_61 [uncultured Caudovirales phage]CAB4193481.1 hypothetical protein UFOVP1239_89 [uncultured Caudovirales phage]CAB4216041.1 hypothetical protein UFOVP1484_65 [uncultured Caudovirales phage]CAB5230714.1 hypothetical protein UFOVP1577_71 [uncultured Caudovirales phage]